ncbi:MAG: recombinase family protein [Proteobacteria bacterium]|nr:recombinase family protein [Pseudomonadota bacterium]
MPSQELQPRIRGSQAKTFAYLRVSTNDQDLEKNKADILSFANTREYVPVQFVEEKVSGKKPWKDRRIKEVIDSLGRGDRLIIPELSRLGRSMLEIMEILSIAREKGISVYALKGDWELNGTIQSKVIAMVFAMAAEIERDLISARTKEALAARKAAGVKLGRPKGPGKSKLDSYRPEIEALLSNGSPKAFVARRYGTTPANLANWLKKNGVAGMPV